MSEAPAPRSVSPLWFLALLPLGLGVGWLVGKLPEPEAKPPVEAAGVTVDGGGTTELALPGAGTTTVRDGANSTFGIPSTPSEVAPASEDQPREIISPWTTPDGAIAESRSNGKAVLLEFSAEWCPPCQAMKRELFDSAILGPAVQKAVIPVAVIDRKREDGENPPQVQGMQEQFDVQAFPTLVVFSPQTGRRVVSKGFSSAERTLRWIEEAAASVQ